MNVNGVDEDVVTVGGTGYLLTLGKMIAMSMHHLWRHTTADKQAMLAQCGG
ncbi:hypothetical protein IPZ64_20935 [Streptomyces violaceoruber]|uniref:hypothetical protein n=1 Tax=Streptomyces violaceoruber TaxID=1935 RepID=UPI001F226543|nr:hypothetical protein [Streptomyces violaceoruber]MCF3169372.1 hypothetical protein [Streptomyces violaceoruber]